MTLTDALALRYDDPYGDLFLWRGETSFSHSDQCLVLQWFLYNRDTNKLISWVTDRNYLLSVGLGAYMSYLMEQLERSNMSLYDSGGVDWQCGPLSRCIDWIAKELQL